MSKKYLVGVYSDDEVMLSAVRNIKNRGIEIFEVYTPFPIHGIDDLLGIKRSRLPIAAFCFGALGGLSAIGMQSYMLGFDWPMDVGGKPNYAFPSFIPITFELTVLIASLGMVAVYLVVNKLFPGQSVSLAHERQTDDRFVIVVEATEGEKDSLVKQAFNDTGAVEVNEKELGISKLDW
ncbi:MAG: DUF3341 domain-containing protein [Bacteroidia bacterium]|nr:DUF3341 domain-containing protein [Bacteroidia bacterium]